MRRPSRPPVAFLSLATAALITTSSLAAPPESDPSSPARVLELVDNNLGKNFVSFPQHSTTIASDADKTLAPFFYVAGGDPETERLPLKAVSAEVQIAGVIARVKVRQSYENGGKTPIEAVYVFPASTRAAVHGMRMKIGERTVEAKIEKRAVARAEYEAAKQSGRRASLLEQQRENVFTMNVANIMPGERIDAELDYSELLVPESAVYEFVFPTVVGPRYGGHADNAGGKGTGEGDKWIANPYLPEGSAEPFPFDIKVHLESGIALKEVASPSHPVAVRYASQSSADVSLDKAGGGATGNRDFILRYRLAGDRIESGMLLFPGPGDSENFFVTLIEPPARPALQQIVPREYIFVLDVSGSMYGFPLNTAKELMRNLLGTLRPTDWFNVVLFAGTSYTMSPHGSVPATPANISNAIGLVDSQRGGGGTELLDALRAAYAVPTTNADDRGNLSRSVVVVTDGYVGVEAQAFKYIRDRLSEANLFAFGIGSSVNRGLIEGMARAGQGEPFVVLNAEKAHAQAERLRAYIEAPVLTNIRAEFDGFAAYDVSPSPSKIPDLMARRPIVLFGKYHGAARGRIRLHGSTSGAGIVQELDVASASARAENSPLRSLWARKWVQTLDDERAVAPGDARLEQSITKLGLDYNILTSFTSFVAVDSEVVNRTGHHDSVNQPLPLPEGVSNHAVGGVAGGVAQGVVGYGALGVVGHGTGGGGVGYGSGSAMTRSYSMNARKGVGVVTPSAAPPPPMSPRPAMIERARAGKAKADAPAAAYGSVASESRSAPSAADKAAREVDEVLAVRQEKTVDSKRPQIPVTPLRALTSARSIQHVGDGSAAILKIEEAVKAAIGDGRAVSVGTLSVRVTLDAQGKVVRLDIQGAEPKLAAEIRRRLVGLSLASRAAGAETGTVEVTFSLTR